MEAIVAGSDHYNTLWVTRSLGKVGYDVTVVILSDTPKCYSAKSKYVKKAYVVANKEELKACLLQIKAEEKVSLFSTDDRVSEYIDLYADELKDRFYLPICGNTSGQLSHWMQKRIMNEKAAEVGFNIPWTKEINLSKEFLTDIKDVPFPCIIKPLKSLYGSKYDVRVCKDYDELVQAQEYLKEHCQHVIVQQFIKPDFEITVDCVRFQRDDNIIIPGVIYKDRTCNSTFNLGMVAFASTDENVVRYINPNILKRFLSEIDYDGLCSFDLFIKDGNTYFLEANLRTDGDMFIYTTAGINFPQLWDYRNRGLDISTLSQGLKRKTHGMIEISYMKYFPWSKPLSGLKEWWNTDCYSIFSWTDIKPFIYKFIYAL